MVAIFFLFLGLNDRDCLRHIGNCKERYSFAWIVFFFVLRIMVLSVICVSKKKKKMARPTFKFENLGVA